MFYLGVTAAEMAKYPGVPGKMAYMACHFSPASRGISNLPRSLPPGSLLMLDDSLPPADHDPALVVRELASAVEHLGCSGVYLDFQREGFPVLGEIARQAAALPCSAAVSAVYAGESPLGVVLPPVAADVPLKRHLAPWQGKEIWLEVSLEGKTLALTPQGCQSSPCPHVPKTGFQDKRLHCHYRAKVSKDAAVFSLWRTDSDLQGLLAEAQEMGVVHTLGLWQELASYLN